MPTASSSGRKGEEGCNDIVLSVYLLVILSCLRAFGQSPPGRVRRLYGARPETESFSGLPKHCVTFRSNRNSTSSCRSISFRDESGQQVKLGRYFGQKPVVLAFVYYDCPMLCTQVLNGMVTSFRVLPFQIGKSLTCDRQFRSTRDEPLAAQRKRFTSNTCPRRCGERNSGWHFLTGDQATSRN
jgi:hypothetical protein